MRSMFRIGALAACTLAAASPAIAGPSLLLDVANGVALHAEDIDQPWYPASITKLMTAYVVFEAVRSGAVGWEDKITLSPHARGQPATRINLRVGIDPTVNEAVHGLILRSANDLAVALAEHVAGSEEAFVARMNATARRLGMSRTVFANPHGLPDPASVTTARDMGVLARAVITGFPERADVFATRTTRIYRGTFYSQNDLLVTLPGADGLKTGYTCGSGYNIVASATRGGRRLVAIVFGAPNRNERSARATDLFEAGFAALGIKERPALPVLIAKLPQAVVKGAAVPDVATPSVVEEEAAPPVRRTAVPIKLGEPRRLDEIPVPAQQVAEAHDVSRLIRIRKCPRPDGRLQPIAAAPPPVAPEPGKPQ